MVVAISIIFFTGPPSIAQIEKSGSLFMYMSEIIESLPGAQGDHYIQPSQDDLMVWSEAISYLVQNDYTKCAEEAFKVNYQLIQFEDTVVNTVFFILEDEGVNFHGTYIYNPAFLLPTVIQSPHPRFDTNTGVQGIHVFLETASMFFCLPGTHRCNQPDLSSCSGTTSVCGPSGPYPISDVAHTVQSFFQETTDVLVRLMDQTVFISLHGFGKQPDDPYLIISNGTRDRPDPDFAYLLGENLVLEDPDLYYEMPHINLSWARLTGFTNTQGRLVNNSMDPCQSNAQYSSGRFIHLEQEKSRLRDDQSGWNKVARAIQNTFNGLSSVPQSEEKGTVSVYPNPAHDFIWFQSHDQVIEQIQIYNTIGQMVYSWPLTSSDGTPVIIPLDKLERGCYYVLYNGKSSVLLKL